MTSFIDCLRETPNHRLDESMRLLKLLSLHDRKDSSHARSLRAEFANSPIDVDACPRMVHFQVSDDIVKLASTLTQEQIDAAHSLYRPIAEVHSLEYFGFCAFVIAIADDRRRIFLADREAKTGDPMWVFEYTPSSLGLTKVDWEYNSALAEIISPPDREMYARRLICLFAAISAVITIPGLCVVSQASPSAVDRKQRKQAQKPALVEIVQYDILRPKSSSDADREEAAEGGAQASEMPLHHVIGHFRLLQKNRPAPVLSFVSPHWKGNAENGIKLKDYRIQKSDIPFAPPTLEVAA